MPRGIAIPEVRQQLFAATERVIVRDGTARLTTRAITREAGVATGLLYAHFPDLDDFLAAYAVDRAFLLCAQAAHLPGRAGTGTVAGNLTDALTATPPDALLAQVQLLSARPGLAGRVRAVLGDTAAGLDAVEQAISHYLTQEQRIGRLPATAVPAALALALVGTLHHLALGAESKPVQRSRIAELTNALINGDAAGFPDPHTTTTENAEPR
ncbi:TetR/AcrR family transcriptional regulator [Pseudonocardia xinjiangensis]|uniref:TetR/AcrR family transcriptional regulator n=1 Tax=Pseudonocardia xinjiangensis TaxID=75289 RepID=A0ABX1RFE7_9PSEU|nr:TetR/AcrR family transcriptional regulator [Pseudonocardia xinjiangensis]NMH79127.1 TetR/AcrR family transcriptional regulator [Pseudonocardia xinjiangensis]